RVAQGYYTIDRPIGLITVTAPRSLLIKITSYLDNLKKELYKQIAIEAKILEITLTDETKTGIDWESLLGGEETFDFNMTFGQLNIGNPLGDSRLLTMSHSGFSLFLNALSKQGETKVLANPKISVLNGQPALISVGENVTYIDSVTSTVDDGVVTYTVQTDSVMSGLGLSVVATIVDDNNIILSLTPVTSKLEKPIEYKFFGGNNQVGLPVVNLREMNTIVKVESGKILVVGGLIDSTNDDNDTKVPILGDIPLIKTLFKSTNKSKIKKELIILLQPKILL
ncbi:MAG: pilus (MSHA type) biogenesis protein MshL, partial [Proteobacteria bacterium]|nr:pilus (MSHA type) biogenesis protein MshL [Pseudomonadota bacterium]MBU1711193.1 pilus (MSHA type) biogenesis protein MshL [Pseudomonadota bacterium]